MSPYPPKFLGSRARYRRSRKMSITVVVRDERKHANTHHLSGFGSDARPSYQAFAAVSICLTLRP